MQHIVHITPNHPWHRTDGKSIALKQSLGYFAVKESSFEMRLDPIQVSKIPRADKPLKIPQRSIPPRLSLEPLWRRGGMSPSPTSLLCGLNFGPSVPNVTGRVESLTSHIRAKFLDLSVHRNESKYDKFVSLKEFISTMWAAITPTMRNLIQGSLSRRGSGTGEGWISFR